MEGEQINHQIFLNFKIWIVKLQIIIGKRKIHKTYLLNLGIYLFFYMNLFFKRRSLQSKYGGNHRALLTVSIIKNVDLPS